MRLKGLFPGNSFQGNTLIERNISYSSMRHVLYEFAFIGWIYGFLTVTSRVEDSSFLGCKTVLLVK